MKNNSLNVIVSLFSGEWMLTECLKANGGEAVVLRACWVTGLIAIITIALRLEWIRNADGTAISLVKHLIDIGGWLSAVFGGVYLALYTRFSSQWSYLASLYNQIKQAEATAGSVASVIAGWKAGFIEDAENLHLACKSSFAPVIKVWSADSAVALAFEKFAPGGKKRWDGLQLRVNAAVDEIERRYK
ncbi:hypothetical protein [Burkholderia territorii]|uniref:hypothetical protein n=1 Tax=Burkholderia territorii TaxID=1503055 RepID=UPI0012D97AFF|nr:hypothetical protein [Burkholderia territorii]